MLSSLNSPSAGLKGPRDDGFKGGSSDAAGWASAQVGNPSGSWGISSLHLIRSQNPVLNGSRTMLQELRRRTQLFLVGIVPY